MPLYDYRCLKCEHVFEVLHGRDQAGPTSCPNCQAASPVKMLSAGNFHLKGGGWYVTDFKNPPQKKDQSIPNTKQTDEKSAPTSTQDNSSKDATKPSDD